MLLFPGSNLVLPIELLPLVSTLLPPLNDLLPGQVRIALCSSIERRSYLVLSSANLIRKMN